MKINMDLRELENYLGITDNENYMAKANLIMEFRNLEDLVKNMDYENLEIIRKEDFYINKLNENNEIVYEHKNLIVYRMK